MNEFNFETESEQAEYVCKLKTKKSKIDYNEYKFYNKNKSFRFLRFLHRGVANIFLRAYLKCVHHVKVIGKENGCGDSVKSHTPARYSDDCHVCVRYAPR